MIFFKKEREKKKKAGVYVQGEVHTGCSAETHLGLRGWFPGDAGEEESWLPRVKSGEDAVEA